MSGKIVREKPQESPGRKRQFKLLVFTALIFVSLGLTLFYFLNIDEEEFVLANFTYAEVEVRDFISWVTARGRLLPRQQVELKAPFNGQLEKWQVELGEYVSEGTLIATLYSEQLFHDLESAQNRLDQLVRELERIDLEIQLEQLQTNREEERINANLKKLQEDVMLKSELFNLQLITYGELLSKRDELEQAVFDQEQFNLRKALAELQADNRRRSYLNDINQTQREIEEINYLIAAQKIYSTADGYLAQQNITSGDSFNKDASLGLFIVDSGLYFCGEVSLADSLRLNLDQTVDFDILGESYAGRLAYLSPFIEEDGNTVKVEIEIFDQEGLRPNLPATANIQIGIRENRLALPRDLYLASGERLFVYLIAEDQAKQTDVFFGRTAGNYIEVERGLTMGDKVITSSYEAFKDKRVIEIDLEGGRQR